MGMGMGEVFILFRRNGSIGEGDPSCDVSITKRTLRRMKLYLCDSTLSSLTNLKLYPCDGILINDRSGIVEAPSKCVPRSGISCCRNRATIVGDGLKQIISGRERRVNVIVVVIDFNFRKSMIASHNLV